MKEFIDKLIERLKAGVDKECASSVPKIRLCDAISIVNELAEEYKGGWIPCSERLPNFGEKVLSSINSPQEHEVIISIYDDRTFRFFEDGTVIAWMPLPAPYTEGE